MARWREETAEERRASGHTKDVICSSVHRRPAGCHQVRHDPAAMLQPSKVLWEDGASGRMLRGGQQGEKREQGGGQ